MTEPARTLVTGATGNIGQALVKHLPQHATSMPVIAASPGGQAVDVAPGRARDRLDAASAQAAMQGVGRVFLLSPAHPEMEAMTARAIVAAPAAGVRHVVREHRAEWL